MKLDENYVRTHYLEWDEFWEANEWQGTPTTTKNIVHVNLTMETGATRNLLFHVQNSIIKLKGIDELLRVEEIFYCTEIGAMVIGVKIRLPERCVKCNRLLGRNELKLRYFELARGIDKEYYKNTL